MMKLEYIFAFFAVIGALDKIFGNRLGLGDEFEKGIKMMGVLMIAMAGIIILAPVIAHGLTVAFKPVAEYLNIDISVISTLIAVDAGGAVMAYEMSSDELMRAYNGIVVASMLGGTIAVAPMALKIIDKKYHTDVFTGFLCGIATIPVGCIVAGLFMGIPFGKLVLNTLPLIILAGIICFGLAIAPDITRKIFGIFGEFLIILLFVGLAIGIIDQLMGIKVIPGTAPISECYMVMGSISIILAGVFPLLAIVSRLFGKFFVKIGEKSGMNETSVMGLITSLANAVPMFSMIEKMNKKGRIINIAFSVSAGFIIGDHMAFTLAFDSTYAMPMAIGKFISGIAALVLASVVIKGMKNKGEEV